MKLADIILTLALCFTAVVARRFSRNDLTIDELLIDSLKSSKDLSLIQSNNTLLMELDIIVTAGEWAERMAQKNNPDRSTRDKRGGIRDQRKRWPGGVLPYAEMSDYYYTDRDRADILNAFREYERLTCIKFVPYQDGVHEGAIKFNGETGCSSVVGFWRGEFYKNMHPMNMHQGCLMKGTLLHELGHVIGLKHEQTRPDRDEYIDIDKDNVGEGKWHNFEKWTDNDIDSKGIPYDYTSIMHYGKYAFARGLTPTITTLDQRYQNVIGQRYGLSLDDIHIINLMYNCLDHCPRTTCPPGGVLSKDCKCMCKLELSYTNGEAGFECNQGRTESTADCEDDSRYCAGEALAGKCDTDKYDMLTKCRRTCGYCGVTRPQPTTRPRPTRPPVDACSDTRVFSEQCQSYKASCDDPSHHTYGWLLLNCKKTCGFCTGSQSTRHGFRGSNGHHSACEDEYGEECKAWKASGSCTNGPYKAVLSKHCKKSCGLCGVAASGRNICIDKARQCQTWAERGECKSNPIEMEELCKKTCKMCNGQRTSFQKGCGWWICPERPDKCEDMNIGCIDWKNRGLCISQERYTRKACPKTCGYCKVKV